MAGLQSNRHLSRLSSGQPGHRYRTHAPENKCHEPPPHRTAPPPKSRQSHIHTVQAPHTASLNHTARWDGKAQRHPSLCPQAQKSRHHTNGINSTDKQPPPGDMQPPQPQTQTHHSADPYAPPYTL
ncbi:hypothetical protein CRENBAI_009019 [Crenichthys baileyi]|uniref:Uncharacterized protein n=1 Tax=Crenichthys baileyi TaxID=28760 RepID=A0AAV9RG83_9TELE